MRHDDLCCQKVRVLNVVDGLAGGFHAQLVGFGLNVELNDTVTITARLLKNSANITVSVDYVMLQPAQTAITSL